MNIDINKVLKFNSEEYLVVDMVDNKYLYLINNDSIKNDTAIVKMVEKYGNVELSNIDNDDEFYYALFKLYISNKRYILNYFDK